MGWSNAGGWQQGGWGAAAPSAPSNVTWTATDNPASQTGTSSATFTSASIGTASSGRIVVVVVNTTSVIATSVTVGGISATKAIEESTIASSLQVWHASVPTGTTANIVVSAGGSFGEVTIQVGMLTGATATPTATNAINNGSSDPLPISITVPTNGVAIAALVINGSATPGVSNATEDYQTTTPAMVMVLCHTSTAGSQAPTFSSFAGGQNHAVAVAWGP